MSSKAAGDSIAGRSGKTTAETNSVRLDLSRLTSLLDELDRRDVSNSNTNRQYVRWPFRHVVLPLTISHLGGSKACLRVACRNISCGGLSVLHSSFLYPGSKCEIAVPDVNGKEVTLRGVLARCSHLTGIIHELGIKFDAAIRIADFAELSPYTGAFSLERVDPNALRGTLIYVGTSELDQRLMRHYLRETQVRLHIMTKPDEIITKALSGVDLIICDSSCATGAESVLAQIRNAGVVTPTIVILPFVSKARTTESNMQVKAEAYLTKPFAQSNLLQAIAEFMMMDDGKGLTSTSLPTNHPSNMLVESFITEVHDQVAKLDAAVRSSDVEKCLVLCQQIAGVAPLVGFEKLSELARQAETAIASTMSIEESVGEVRRLITTCQNVRARQD